MKTDFEELRTYIFENATLTFDEDLSSSTSRDKIKSWLQQIEKTFENHARAFLHRLFNVIVNLINHPQKLSDFEEKYWNEKLMIASHQDDYYVYHTTNNKLLSLEEKIILENNIIVLNQLKRDQFQQFFKSNYGPKGWKTKEIEIPLSLFEQRRKSGNPILYNFIQITEHQCQVEFIVQIKVNKNKPTKAH